MKANFDLTGAETAALREIFDARSIAATTAGNYSAAAAWDEASSLLTKARNEAFDRKVSERIALRAKRERAKLLSSH